MREIKPEYFNAYTVAKDVLKNLVFILLAAATGFMGVRAYYTFTYTPVYASSATIAVSATDSGYYTYSNLNKTIETASTFQEMFQSTYFKEKLAEIIGEPVSGTITASQVSETNLITISYTCDSPVTAFKTMTAILDNYNDITDNTFKNMIINIVSAPYVPSGPSNVIDYNNYDYIAAIALAAVVLAVTVVISFLRDTIKNESDVEAFLDTKLFGVIYHEDKNKTIRSKLGFTHSREPLIITNILINYRFAESFRIAALKLEYILSTKNYKTVMVTSCGENEGKSTVAVNLALSMASLGKKTLLVDSDLRKPAVFKFFSKNIDENKSLGVGEIIKGKISVNDSVIRDSDTGLYVISGKQKYRNSSELLAAHRVERLVDSLKQQFDVIIFDTAPMSLVSDAEIIAGYIDASVMVVRQDIAAVPEINDMLDVLTISGSDVLGCIFNDVHLLPTSGSGRMAAAGDYQPGEHKGGQSDE